MLNTVNAPGPLCKALRHIGNDGLLHPSEPNKPHPICAHAADVIEHLQADLHRLTHACDKILPYLDYTTNSEVPPHHPTLRSAIEDFRATQSFLAERQNSETLKVPLICRSIRLD